MIKAGKYSLMASLSITNRHFKIRGKCSRYNFLTFRVNEISWLHISSTLSMVSKVQFSRSDQWKSNGQLRNLPESYPFYCVIFTISDFDLPRINLIWFIWSIGNQTNCEFIVTTLCTNSPVKSGTIWKMIPLEIQDTVLNTMLILYHKLSSPNV